MLFNNGGVVPGGSAEATSETDWQRVFDLNVTAVWRMSRLVLPAMRAQGSGAIVNNASDWASERVHLLYCTWISSRRPTTAPEAGEGAAELIYR